MVSEQELIKRLHDRMLIWENALHWKIPGRQHITFELHQHGDSKSGVTARINAMTAEAGDGWEMYYEADLSSLYHVAKRKVGPRPGYPWDGGFGHFVESYDSKVAKALVEVFADGAVRYFNISLDKQEFIYRG